MMRSQQPTLRPEADYETAKNCEWRLAAMALFPFWGKSTSGSLKRPRPKVAAGGNSINKPPAVQLLWQGDNALKVRNRTAP